MGRLRKPYEFKEVFSGGKRLPGKYFILFVKATQSHSSRIGLAVSKKTGTAVERNRVKRLYREALKKLTQDLSRSRGITKHYDYVFVGKRECVTATMADVYEELKKMFMKLEVQRQ